MIGRIFAPKVSEVTEPKGFDDYDLRLGDVMRGERATLGKSLLDVQRELKIKAAYIAAIENADPSAFETPGFIAGYVRSYARYLTIDPEWAYTKFCEEGNFATAHGMSAMASSPKPAKKSYRSNEDRDPFANPNAPFVPRKQKMFSTIEPGALGSVAVLLMLIGGLGYGGWSVLQEVQKVQLSPIDQAPGVTSDLDPLGGTEIALAAGINGPTAPSAGFEAPPIEAMDRLYRPQALDVPVLVARDGPIAALDPASSGAFVPEDQERLASLVTTSDDLPAIEDAVQVVEPQSAAVILLAVRPAWVRIRGADGTIIFEKILDAGEEYALPNSEEPPTLRAGNSGSVYFKVAGQTYGPAGTGTSTAKNVALSPELLTGAYTVADIATDSDLAKIVTVAQAQTVPVTE